MAETEIHIQVEGHKGFQSFHLCRMESQCPVLLANPMGELKTFLASSFDPYENWWLDHGVSMDARAIVRVDIGFYIETIF